MMMLYLHGFRSSPSSFKARLLDDYFSTHGLIERWRCPQLPASPKQVVDLARAQAQELLQTCHETPQSLTIVGSSLGGYYAIALAEELDCRAVLINPAVHAARDLATQVGEHTHYHSNEPMTFEPQYVDELADMAVPKITKPQRYLLIAATGDELLDWREMVKFMDGAHQIIVPGSDHGLSDFEKYMPRVLAFADGLTPSSQVD
ncbi:YqiA/YcfP family alpha/beta fold hydrolase [Orrella daihaiensis]|uniref:Alpha/beta fold hydrolase n=1 Tax=Orrella daihaiensis TaxID=2782176 RepID=A0ABY4AJ35_9BURK|nr:YqiA/YcfP family alpha/beta fold hydrolase [Orrella daihaiensis]UOD50184.1 alpha/beta fold hydrolase [Orrella daihaiensis]